MPPPGPWSTLQTGSNLTGDFSPDGAYLLVSDAYGWDTSATLYRGTEMIRRLDGDSDVVTWIDPTSFLVLRWARDANGPEYDVVQAAFVAQVDSAKVTRVELPSGVAGGGEALGNGHGQVAYVTANVVPGDASRDEFRVWDGATSTKAMTGVPMAWSRDGTRLAVLHIVDTSHFQALGWIEILEWPSLKPLFSDRRIRTPLGDIGFDPSGRYFGYWSGGPTVLDIETGTTTTIGPTFDERGSDDVAWFDGGTAGSQLMIPLVDNSVSTYSLSGASVGTQPDVGDAVAASADGSLAVGYYGPFGDDDPLTIALMTASGSRQVDLPGKIDEIGPTVAPDGQAVFVSVLAAGGPTAFLLQP